MISEASRPYIDASVPVLREHGVAITKVFYRNLFNNHPEFTNVFNMGNQANGTQQQSLASAVFAYAANISNPTALSPVISRIVQKHASVGIRAEHYPIVGSHLLAAIKEVLGEAATQPLMAAWGEAYDSLAKLLVEAEAEVYANLNIEPGDTSSMRVTTLSRESDDVLAITMEPIDGSPPPCFRSGQYVSVTVTFEDGHKQIRQYSLSDAPGKPLRISVKREGEVSRWLYANVNVDTVLQVSKPFGDFLPDTETNEPIVLLSAGVGITPMISTVKRIAQVNPERHVLFAHATRSAAHHAHQADITTAKEVMPNLHVVTFYEQGAEGDILPGRMELTRLPSWPRTETDVWMCGPIAFMQTQWKALREAGVPQDKLHREIFGPEALDHIL